MIRLRWDAILTVIVTFAVGIVLGMGIQSHVTSTVLPPCPTEDSTGCYWDADTMGNGQGDDLWNGVPACTDAIADAGGICHGEP